LKTIKVLKITMAVYFLIISFIHAVPILRIGEGNPRCRKITDNDIYRFYRSSNILTIEETFKKEKIDWNELYRKAIEQGKSRGLGSKVVKKG